MPCHLLINISELRALKRSSTTLKAKEEDAISSKKIFSLFPSFYEFKPKVNC